MCKVSILMPVYNGEEHLRDAIESILEQSFEDFELLLLIENGSSDASLKIAHSYKDKRIKIVENKERLGLPESLNEGIRRAIGEYIARMDADDISYKNRLKRQVDYLDKHKEVVLIGTRARINGSRFRLARIPYSSEEIRFVSFFRAAFIHPTVMWRRVILQEADIQYNNLQAAEDYDLWTRIVFKYDTANLKEALVSYRIDGTGKTFSNKGQIPTYEINKKLFEKFGMQYDIDDWMFSRSESQVIFEKKLNIVEKVTQQFDFQDIKYIFKSEIISLFVLNNHYEVKEFMNRFGEKFSSPLDKVSISWIFFVEKIKYLIKKRVK